jgi:hypothetical protein
MSCSGIFFEKHNWGMWEVKQRLQLRRTHNNTHCGEMLIQERRCNLCGKTEVNKQEITI